VERQQPPPADKRQPAPYTARLLIDCADRPGIVAAVSGFLFERGANIVTSNQYSSDPTGGRFYLRTEFVLGSLGEREGEGEGGWPDDVGIARAGTGLGEARLAFERHFAVEVAERFGMEWRVRWQGERRRIAILVSRHDHCLMELLWRWRRAELDADVVGVVSNHPDLAGQARAAGVPFHHVPVERDAKEQAERQMIEILSGNVDLVVLARYMQILSGDFLERLGAPAINIHHSFLPAFAGADPYRRAREHGVKLIGATAHYVTEELDGGPIIEQDVARVDHRHTVSDLEAIGRDIERLVLWRAVQLHLEDRVIADEGRTIVF
jgi:formyltetrahydrofolate deformylase